MEIKTIIKNKWNGRIQEIAENREWNEILDHFQKHLLEMMRLNVKDEPERAIDKANSILNLAAISIKKMGIDFDLENIDHEKLLERIEIHDKYLAEKARMEEQDRLNALRKKRQEEMDDDTD